MTGAPAPAPVPLARAVVLAFFFVALALAVYSPTLNADFVWDDVPLIVENENAHSLSAAARHVFSPFWNDDLKFETLGYFRPVVAMSYALDWAISDGRAGWFHLMNVLAHAANAFLLCLLMLRRRHPLFSAVSWASLFAVTARAVENVAWVSGRTDVYATLFLALGYFAFEARKHLLAALCIGLSLGCKEVGLGGLAALGLMAILQPQKNVRLLAFLLGVIGLYGLLRLASGTQNNGVHLPFVSRLMTVGEALAHSTLGMMTPWGFKLDYPGLLMEPAWVSIVGLGLFGALILACVTLVQRARTDTQRLFFGLSGVAALILPSHIFSMPYDLVSADRFLYLPLFSAISVLATFRMPAWVTLGVTALCVPTGVNANRYAREWTNSLTLWSRNVARSSGSQTLSGNLADALAVEHRCDEALRWYAEAETQARETVARLKLNDSQSSRAMHGRAKCLEQLGRYGEAVATLGEVIRLRPDWKRPRFNLVLAHLRSRHFEEALSQLAELQRQNSSDPRLAAMKKGIEEAMQQRLVIDDLKSRGQQLEWLDAELNYSAQQGETQQQLEMARRILNEIKTLNEAAATMRTRALLTLVQKAPRAEAVKALDAPELKNTPGLLEAAREQLNLRFADSETPPAP